MKNLFLMTISSLFFSLSVYAQDKTFDLSSFTSIDASSGIEITLYKGEPRADVIMKKGDIDDLVIKQSGQNLVLNFKQKISFFGNSGNRQAVVSLYYDTDISDVQVSAGASVECDETMKVNAMDCDASSGGTIELIVEANTTDIDVSSGASVEIEGRTDQLDVDVSSGASFNGKNFKAEKVDADSSSGASAKVWVTNEIDASSSSGGSIRYKGDPTKKDLDSGKWSGGSISKM